MGDRQHQAPRERSQPPVRRRNQNGLGRLHGLRQASSGTGKNQSPLGTRVAEARRLGKSTRSLSGAARSQGRALKSERPIPLSGRKHTTMDLLTIAKNIADRVEAESFE